ncbi:histone acetyltransferase, MYST superfamily [Crepidotus variabilis]|uniref:histone acetyltransferase n=1 Tax=Crepidotus variabilis TaxID=179855 RepID=A0A9P6EGL9_9AGAR|nr:histone acetyltransferase, MYST superfamily [Crepidotus variabilis]
MVSQSGPSADAGPPIITPGGTYSITTVSVGCKIYIKRPGPTGENEERLAEILSIRDKRVNIYGRPKVEETGTPKPEDREYFVHWDQFNKRLDEWVSGSRLLLSRDLEWPRSKAAAQSKKATPAKKPGKAPRGASLLKKATSNAAFAASPTPGPSTPMMVDDYPPSPSPASSPSLKRKMPHDEEEEEEEEEEDAEGEDVDAEGEMDMDGEGEVETFELNLHETPQEPPPIATFSKEKEIEKLRTSGSMTQSVSEIARVKNLNRLQIGAHEVDAWYFSPYPKEYAHLPVLYICEFCLAFFPSPFMFSRHRQRCNMLHPPGNEIYRHEDISFYEIDGKRQLTWCRNLSLLSKCFLDHKTLYYDVTPFLYYCMAKRDASGCHLIGYFSKEKESADNYNVACILTLPQHQRHGYGKLLIEFSYELSKKEGKLGSPEKPLSDLGLLGYRAYWAETIIDLLLTSGESELSIEEIAQKTAITHSDVMNTCTTLQLFKHYKGQHMICLNNAVMEKHQKTKAKKRRRIYAEHLKWKPPVFTRDQLRFGF